MAVVGKGRRLADFVRTGSLVAQETLKLMPFAPVPDSIGLPGEVVPPLHFQPA